MTGLPLLPADEFLAWASGIGVGVHPEYPQSDRLTLLPPAGHSRFWVRPDFVNEWPPFLDALTDGLDDWEHGYLWPGGGQWPAPVGRLQSIVFRGVGIPAGHFGAVRVDRPDAAGVMAALFATLLFGGDTSDDVLFLPDHGRQLLMASHHDVIHVECRTADRMARFVADMQAAGYELPTEPPDWTFRWPAWMGPTPPDWPV